MMQRVAGQVSFGLNGDSSLLDAVPAPGRMRLMRPLLGGAGRHRGLLGAVAACGMFAAGGALAAGATPTTIRGGSTAQQGLLREILRALGPTRIRELRIVPARGGVNLDAPLHGTPVRPDWETAVAGIAFHDLSAEQHLPRVVWIHAGGLGWPTSNEGPRPPQATKASVLATRRLIRRLALASGAKLTELTVSAPDGLAVALRLRVHNAAKFLVDRLRRLVDRAKAREKQYEGLLVEVDDAHGLAWADGNTRVGGDDYVRPSLAGCNPFPPPYQPVPPPRCPVPR